MDIIKELRLRRWARENYVAPNERSDRWDAVILNEMSVMDRDIADRQAEADLLSAYVPVRESAAHEQMRRIHRPHNGIPEPNFISGVPERSDLYIG